MEVCVVIPTKNEAKTIGEVIDSIKPLGYRILVVDSKKSKDRTVAIAKAKGADVIVDNGMGKGEGMRVAIKNCKSDVLVFFDADMSHVPEDIPSVVKPILKGKADMVVASRMLGGSEELHGTIGEAFRLFASVIITLIINYRYGVHITDSQNGFRAIKRDVARKLNLEANIFDIETEMCIKCAKMGYRISEVPSREHRRKFGPSGVNPITMGPTYAWRVFKNLM